MSNTDEKRMILIDAAKDLLLECRDVDEVTTRSIADRAGMNPAMVNYYYGSKDELITEAIDSIFGGTVNRLDSAEAERGNPRKALFDFLMTMSEQVISLEKYSKSIIPDIIMNKEIELPFVILPAVRRCLDGKKTEEECKTVAYELTVFMQLVFYRSEAFRKYSGVDLFDRSQRRLFISRQLDVFLGESL